MARRRGGPMGGRAGDNVPVSKFMYMLTLRSEEMESWASMSEENKSSASLPTSCMALISAMKTPAEDVIAPSVHGASAISKPTMQ